MIHLIYENSFDMAISFLIYIYIYIYKISFFNLYIMLHTCVQRFDVMFFDKIYGELNQASVANYDSVGP